MSILIHLCLILDNYSFDTTGAVLHLKESALSYSSTRLNLFVVTAYLANASQSFTQMTTVNVDPNSMKLPILSMQCRIVDFCSLNAHANFFLISESNNLVLKASCIDECQNEDSLSYMFTVSKNVGNSTDVIWSALDAAELAHTFGQQTDELKIKRTLFENSAFYWKVDLTARSGLLQANNSATMLFVINQKPTGGSCSVNGIDSGYAMSTVFSFRCSNWIDPDGVVTRYEFFGNFSILLRELNIFCYKNKKSYLILVFSQSS